MPDHLATLERIQGLMIESLGLWAAEDPDLDRLAALAGEAETLAAGLVASPGRSAEEAQAAAEADRLRAAVAQAAAEHDAALRQAWAQEQRREAALRSARRTPASPGEARFYDQRH